MLDPTIILIMVSSTSSLYVLFFFCFFFLFVLATHKITRLQNIDSAKKRSNPITKRGEENIYTEKIKTTNTCSRERTSRERNLNRQVGTRYLNHWANPQILFVLYFHSGEKNQDLISKKDSKQDVGRRCESVPSIILIRAPFTSLLYIFH